MPEDQQGKIPNKEKNLRVSEKFNEEFRNHLTRIGWTDPEIQKRFVALINSYILSGENRSSQDVIVNYLDKGLDVLNIELKRIEITKGNNVVQVDPDEVDEKEQQNPEQKIESTKLVDIFKKELSENKKRNDIVRKILDKSDGDKNKIEEYINSTVNTLLEDRILKEQGSINSNNFRVFFGNYLEDEKSWSSENIDNFANNILNIVEKGAGNINGQKQAVRETDHLLDRMSKVMDIKSAPQTKNSQIAFNELATFASKLRGWSSEFFSEFVSNILEIIGSSGSQKSQRYIVDKVNSIESSIKSKEKKEDSEEDSKESDNKEEESDKKSEKKEIKESKGDRNKEAHKRVHEEYGVDIDDALNKFHDMWKVDAIQKLPDGFIEKLSTKLESKYNKDLIEEIITTITHKPERFKTWEMEDLVIRFASQGELPEDVFEVIDRIYKIFKQQEVI